MIINKIISKIYFAFLKIAYQVKSNNKLTDGSFIAHQPVILRGQGQIIFGANVNIGVPNSPNFYNTYAYIESRNINAVIRFGDNININNSFSVIAEKRITIEDNVLIGLNCSIIDSDFHNLNPLYRNLNNHKAKEVTLSRNVFLGNNVTILKGVTIGENTVIAAGSIVTKSFPANVIIGGNPAKIIRYL